MFSNREDNDNRFALGVAFVLIGIIVVTLISTIVYKSRHSNNAHSVASMSDTASSLASEPAQAVASFASSAEEVASQVSNDASASPISADTPSLVVENGLVIVRSRCRFWSFRNQRGSEFLQYFFPGSTFLHFDVI